MSCPTLELFACAIHNVKFVVGRLDIEQGLGLRISVLTSTL